MLLTLLPAAAAYWAAACAVALGPGYAIVKQELSVQFQPNPEPIVRIEATYQLKNTGNQPLASLELRLPGRRRFHFADPRAEWDKTALTFEPSPDNPRNAQLKFPQPWKVSSLHTLRLSVEYQRAAADEAVLSFTPDAFFLPAQGWSPEFSPPAAYHPKNGTSWCKFRMIFSSTPAAISNAGRKTREMAVRKSSARCRTPKMGIHLSSPAAFPPRHLTRAAKR